MGDAFCAAFPRASDAVAAVVDAQRGRRATIGALSVSGAPLHSGATNRHDGDYFGPTVNRAARLLSIGHGGQILISRATRELAHDDLPGGDRIESLISALRGWPLSIQ
ncbi:MAG TPA: adenylate/guanylate cyclase domain-containing protein [Candidatus Cybelea sp.]